MKIIGIEYWYFYNHQYVLLFYKDILNKHLVHKLTELVVFEALRIFYILSAFLYTIKL